MEDLRTQKTIKAIEQATLELIEQKGFSKLRMSEIAKKAVVNRNTIYLHYPSKEDIVISILEHRISFSEILMFTGRIFKQTMSKAKTKELFLKVLETIQKDTYLFKIVLTDPLLSGYMTSVNSKIKDLAYRCVKQESENKTIIEYIVSGTFGVMERWIIFQNHDINEIANQLTELSFSNMKMLKR